MSQIPPVLLSEYDENWPRLFYKEKIVLLKAIGDHVFTVEHIGSTAVPDLPAKPEIDILITLPRLSKGENCIKPLEKLGYGYYPHFEEAVPERKYFRKSDPDSLQPLVHIHMVHHDSPFGHEQLRFRNHLIANSEIADRYAQLKRDLASNHTNDRPTYSKKKKEFVDDVLAKLSLN